MDIEISIREYLYQHWPPNLSIGQALHQMFDIVATIYSLYNYIKPRNTPE